LPFSSILLLFAGDGEYVEESAREYAPGEGRNRGLSFVRLTGVKMFSGTGERGGGVEGEAGGESGDWGGGVSGDPDRDIDLGGVVAMASMVVGSGLQ
jgi:hypothetical protein